MQDLNGGSENVYKMVKQEKNTTFLINPHSSFFCERNHFPQYFHCFYHIVLFLKYCLNLFLKHKSDYENIYV